jgi:hypothetical protein
MSERIDVTTLNLTFMNIIVSLSTIYRRYTALHKVWKINIIIKIWNYILIFKNTFKSCTLTPLERYKLSDVTCTLLRRQICNFKSLSTRFVNHLSSCWTRSALRQLVCVCMYVCVCVCSSFGALLCVVTLQASYSNLYVLNNFCHPTHTHTHTGTWHGNFIDIS